MRFCKHCGEPLVDPKNFCPNCGSKIENYTISRTNNISRINSTEILESEGRSDKKETLITESGTDTKEFSITESGIDTKEFSRIESGTDTKEFSRIESGTDTKKFSRKENETNTKEISRTESRTIIVEKSGSEISSQDPKFKLRRLNWRVYVLIGLFILLAITYFMFDPFNKDIAFAKWGDLSDKEKVALVTEFKEGQYPDIESPTVDDIVKYCNLLYKDSSSEDDTIDSVVSEFIEWDKEERIRAVAELSGDIIDGKSSNEKKAAEEDQR